MTPLLSCPAVFPTNDCLDGFFSFLFLQDHADGKGAAKDLEGKAPTTTVSNAGKHEPAAVVAARAAEAQATQAANAAMAAATAAAEADAAAEDAAAEAQEAAMEAERAAQEAAASRTWDTETPAEAIEETRPSVAKQVRKASRVASV